MRRLITAALVAALFLSGGALATRDTRALPFRAQPADAISAKASGTVRESIALGVPVPTWLVNYLLKRFSWLTINQLLRGQGYVCPGGSPFLCYIQGSYDPPRWGRGTVDTGGSAYWLNARSWTGRGYPVVRTFPNGWRLTIFCQTRGEWVYGRWGWTNVWNFIGVQGDTPRFVSDGFVFTGTNSFCRW